MCVACLERGVFFLLGSSFWPRHLMATKISSWMIDDDDDDDDDDDEDDFCARTIENVDASVLSVLLLVLIFTFSQAVDIRQRLIINTIISKICIPIDTIS